VTFRRTPPAALLWLYLLAGNSGHLAAKTACHIHPPVDTNTDAQPTPALIGPFDDRGACEDARQQRFGALGRCHCSASFTPGWVGRESGSASMPPGLPPGAAMP
jgi:hypothetical protein